MCAHPEIYTLEYIWNRDRILKKQRDYEFQDPLPPAPPPGSFNTWRYLKRGITLVVTHSGEKTINLKGQIWVGSDLISATY